MVCWKEYRRLNRVDLPRESCVNCQRGSRWQIMVALVHTLELRCIMVVLANERTKVTLKDKKTIYRVQEA